MSLKKERINSQFLVYQKNVMHEVKKVYYDKKSDQLCTGEQALYVLKIIKKITND